MAQARAAFQHIRAQGAELVVTVDCGAAAYDAIAAAAEIGLEVVVIDHHLMRENPPPATAVVNPNRPGCPSGQGVLAAAGVTFVLLAALEPRSEAARAVRRARPSRTCANGSTSRRSARSATSPPSPASTARWWARG